MYYWFTKNNYKFAATPDEAYNLIKKNEANCTYHGATDGSIYLKAMEEEKPKLKLKNVVMVDNVPVLTGGKDEELIAAENLYQKALNDAIDKEIERADKTQMPDNPDVKMGTSDGSVSREAVIRKILG